ncbi:MAG: insulinase family protein [Sneathiella sp.]|nr:insulinase family protein [Sneathiella sp.]
MFSLPSQMRTLSSLMASILMLMVVLVGTVKATEIQEITSPGGIKAWFVEERSIPILSMEVAWKGGSSIEAAEKAGLANLVASTMDEGAGDFDSRAFQKRLSDNAISLKFNASKDSFQGSLKTLSKNREEAFSLFSIALTDPRFDAEPVERIRNQILVGLNRKLSDPNSLAGRAWFEIAFPNHPYSVPTEGVIETVSKITQKDLVDFKKDQIARDNMVVAVIGDIGKDELGLLLDKTFLGVQKTARLVEVPDVKPMHQLSEKIIEQDIPQSVVVFGGAGVKRDDPDYYAAYILNYILGGGGFESRLTKEIREKRGLVYSVYSYLYPLRHSGLQLGGFGTSNASVGEAVKLLKTELLKIRKDGVTADELAAAKTYINGSFPLRLSSNSKIANIMVSMQVFDLPVQYLNDRPGYINAVTLDDILRVAQRLINPENMIITVVGKPEGL